MTASTLLGAELMVYPPFAEVLFRLLRPETLTRIIVEGMGKAAVFFIISVGLTLIFGLMGVLNFAHGAMTMLGAYLGGVVMVVVFSGGPGGLTQVVLLFVSMAVVFAILTGFGSAVESRLIRPIYDRPPMYQILLTFGVTLVLEELARIIATSRGIQPEPSWQAALGTAPDFLVARYDVFGANIRGLYFFHMLVGLAVLAVVRGFLTRTLYGLHIRAGSEDSEMVEALGIDVRQAFTVVFGVGTGLAGIGGVMLMWDPLWGPSVLMNIETLLIAFVIVIIGGLGTFKGTVIASLVVGITDSFATWLFQTGIVAFAGLPEILLFLILIVMLIIRPQGIYGLEEVGDH